MFEMMNRSMKRRVMKSWKWSRSIVSFLVIPLLVNFRVKRIKRISTPILISRIPNLKRLLPSLMTKAQLKLLPHQSSGKREWAYQMDSIMRRKETSGLLMKVVATRRSQVSSERQKCDKIFDGLVKMLKTQQEQLKTLARERKFLGDRIKMQHEKWVSDFHLYEDQISQMKSSMEAQDMMRFLEAAKSDMVVGLKRREASFLKLKLENIGDKLADFRAWFDILRYNPTIWLVAQSQLVQRWSKGK